MIGPINMEYTTETLDHSTGELKEISLGNWITVTELGELYRVGPKQVRSILHHMGLLQSEGRHGWYRLTSHAVAQGLGNRIDKSRSGFPFDVISPLGQLLIAQVWDETVADLEQERRGDPQVEEARASLGAFKMQRLRPLTTQEEVCWMKDHYPDMRHDQIARVLEVSPPLVTRYANQRREQRDFITRQKAKAFTDRVTSSRAVDEVP
jgi:hypothetical protein